MATGGVLGDGTKVAYSIGSPLAWTEITGLINADGPGLEADVVNNDVHGSAGFHREMSGLFAVSPMTLTLREDLDPSTSPDHETLWSLLQQKTTVWWRKEVPVNREKTLFRGIEFQGVVASYVEATPIDDRQTSEVAVRFDGTAIGKMAVGASEI